MTPTVRLLSLIAVLAILAGAFFALVDRGDDAEKPQPPHSLQQ